jgi:copper homeostasis protein
MISAVKAAVKIPVFVIVRPRGGGFVYADAEIGVMRLDIEAARMLGADGVVAGALTADARVHAEQMRAMVDVAAGLPVTFHRAFDLTPDLGASLEAVMALGIKRVLTSGGAPSALDGVAQIASLVKRAAGAVTVLAGGSVREENVQEIVHRSGVAEVHVRGTRLLSRGRAGRDGMRLRKPLPEDESAWEETDERRIKEFVRLANG